MSKKTPAPTKLRLHDVKSIAEAQQQQAPEEQATEVEQPRIPWTAGEKKQYKHIFDELYWFDPPTREEGDDWIVELGELMIEIMQNAKAYHRMKCETPRFRSISSIKSRLEMLKEKKSRTQG